MARYVLKRLGFIVLVLFMISLIMFILFDNMPGDRVGMFMMGMMEGMGTDMTPEMVEEMRRTIEQQLGLDRSMPVRYISWITNMLRGDWGYSVIHRRPVLEVVRVPMMWTIFMSLISQAIIFVLTIPLGIITAVKRGSHLDSSVLVFTVIGLSLPLFMFALLNIVLFSVVLGVLPVSGMTSAIQPDDTWGRFIDRAQHMVLPVLTIVIASLGGLTRYVRAAMCDALTEDYVRTARAKGLTNKIVIYSHAFRNALIPMVTLMTASFIGIFSGSVVIERIFSWSGMGGVMLNSLLESDYAVAMAMNVFYALVSLVAILMMDLAYGLVDPRVKVA